VAIPVIDIFAGPGGLGEGFCSMLNTEGEKVFKIALSIEKDEHAHQTLTLRSFFRQFESGKVPDDYYAFLQQKITLDELYERWPEQATHAKHEAWNAKLGDEKGAVSAIEVDKRIDEALKGHKNWLLIGGPPCQAYSVVGRVRRQQTILDGQADERVVLYKQYLRILAVHNPAVFVMENVKCLLSAQNEQSPVFSKILKDLSDPLSVYYADFKKNGRELHCPGYKIYSLIVPAKKLDVDGNPTFSQKDYLIHAEKFGIPQTRHRVILLGIRKDIEIIPSVIKSEDEIQLSKVLTGLPRVRSRLSKKADSNETWRSAVSNIIKRGTLTGIDKKVREEVEKQLESIQLPVHSFGGEFLPYEPTVLYKAEWFLDPKIKGICNHSARGHMESDLLRYFFISCFGKVMNYSPQLEDFPAALLPNHKNVFKKNGDITRKFADRFRVQLKNKASKTVTSHISQDGHYFIHYDPTQCRSFTVREAARVQTFPDNYFFCGPRTAQFIQVGNAVPPLLAYKIAEVVSEIFLKLAAMSSGKKTNKQNVRQVAHI
jgi:DNA (cytosine-5)-methyltransferase 1